MLNADPSPFSIGIISGRDLTGDALIKLPFLRALRHAFPKAEIHWITSQGPTAFGGVLREATRGLIDQVHETPRWISIQHPAFSVQKETNSLNPESWMLNPPFFDLLIDTRGRWRTTLEAKKIPHKLFLASAWQFLFSDRRPSLFRKRPLHLSDRLLQYVELAAGYLPPSTGALPVPDDLLQKAKQLLPPGKTYVALAPGCSTSGRMWPRERFEQIALRQIAKGRTIVFILGPQELNTYDALKAAVPPALFPLQQYDVWGTKNLTLNHTLALGTQLNLTVANDSGPGHIMAAVDGAVLSLFGPTTPLKAAPRTSHGRSIRAQDFGGATMQDIPVDAVDRTIDEMLSQRS